MNQIIDIQEEKKVNLKTDNKKEIPAIIVSIVTLLPIKSRFFSSNSSKSDFSINNFIN